MNLLRLLGIGLLRVRLVDLLAADAEGHPVAGADDEEHAENGHPVVAAALEGVALLDVRGGDRAHVAGIGEQRGRQVEDRDAEEGRRWQEAAIHLLREADEAADETHHQCHRDRDGVLATEMTVDAEDKVAGWERRGSATRRCRRRRSRR